MDTLDLFLRLGSSLAIGLLIGLERGWRGRDMKAGSRTAGIRTFALIGLLGGLWGAMTPALGPVPMAAAGLAFAMAFILFEWRETTARHDYSVTSTIAGFIVFALGAYAVLGNQTVAAGAGVATLVLLAARSNLHEFLKQLTWPELRSAIVLLAMTFLLLPVLPNRNIDPWDAINPYDLWLLTVMIAVLGFAGYVAVRLLGEHRGLLVASAAGALVSSTTVTLNNSRLAAKGASDNPTLSIAILAAWMVSLARMSGIAIAVNPMLLPTLAPPIGAALAALALAAILFHQFAGKDGDDTKVAFQNPLDLVFVLRFGALLSAIIVASKLLSDAVGEGGVLGLAVVTGFVDVDPIALSSARAAGGSLTLEVAVQAILLAGAANLVAKMAATILVGGTGFGMKLTFAGVVAMAAGAAVVAATGLL